MQILLNHKTALLTALLFIAFSNSKAQTNVGIGTTNPTEKLQVAGNIKADTLKPSAIKLMPNAAKGKVLISDASGNGTWQNKELSIYRASGFLAGSGGVISAGESYVLKDWQNLNTLGLGLSNYIFNSGAGDLFVLNAGTYRITGKVTFFAGASNNPDANLSRFGIMLNGSPNFFSEIYQTFPRGYYTVSITTIVKLQAQDYIRFVLTNVSGGLSQIGLSTTASQSEFTVEKLD